MPPSIYPERDYRQRKKFGLYLEPSDEVLHWGLKVHGVGNYVSQCRDMSASGRVLKEYALLLVREGSGFLVEKKGEKIPLQKGSVVIIVPGWWHFYNVDPNVEWMTAWVIFDGPMVESLHAKGEITQGLFASNVGDLGLHELGLIIDDMIDLAMDRADTSQVHARLSVEVMRMLARICDWKTQHQLGEHVSAIFKAVSYVEENFTSSIHFDQLQEESGMSQPHFRRQFKKLTNHGPQTYQKRLRIRMAKELLRHSDLTVAEVGKRVGYTKAPYFSRVFNTRVGVTPSVWRESGM